MDIDRDDGDDPRARREWMIREFQEARRRRLVKPGGQAPHPPTDTDTHERSATTPTDAEALPQRNSTPTPR